MAMTDWPSFRIPSVGGWTAAGPGVSSITLNANGDRCAFIIQCPKAGTLDKFEFQTNTVANNPDNGIRLSFQTVDLATGSADGTQDQFRDITGTISSATWQVPGLMTSDGTDTGSKRTVTAGELLACVVDFVTFVAADSFTVQVLATNATGSSRNQYTDSAATGTYTKDDLQLPILALKYNDGTYAEFDVPIWPISAVDAVATGTGSTPDERALKIVSLPQSMRMTGAWCVGDLDAACDLVLYDAASNVVDTISFDSDQRTNGSSGIYYAVWPAGPHTLSAATVYRVALKPTTASTVVLRTFVLPSNAYWGCMPGGSNLILSTRTDAGAWTDDDTRRPLIGLVMNGVESGHMFRHPGMSGGLNG